MSLFYFHFDKRIYVILITSFLWALNFRSTFKNNSDSMGLGSCWVLRFDPMIILIKNIFCVFYFLVFFYEIKVSRAKNDIEKVYEQKSIGKNQIALQITDVEHKGETILNAVEKAKNLEKWYQKLLFWIKIISIILIIYIVEELYFLLSNNHVLDRVIIPIRNLGILLALFIFSPLILKQPCNYNRHQIIPFIIIFINSLIIVLFNVFGVDRFLKKFKAVNSSIYYSTYFLMGLELVLIKYLTDHEFISIFLILGIKGIFGTIIFIGINASCTKKQFFDFLDKILEFEYDDMLDEFEVIYKIIYIITLVIIQWFKLYIINRFSENHLQMILMMTDLIYFPLYCIERLAIQKFSVFRMDSFALNVVTGILNIFFMLIFNEILECNFLGLNKDLKNNINIRQGKDYYRMMDGLNDDDESRGTIQRNSTEERSSDIDNNQSADNINQ